MTITEILKQMTDRLSAVGIDTANLDARVLLAEVLGCKPLDLFLDPDKELTADQQDRLEQYVDARLARQPVSQILGEKEFWSLTFKITPDTLTPRPDSETLIEVALKHIDDVNRPLHILDLGTGTGCLLLSLLHECPKASGVGVDVSEAALQVATENVQRLGLSERANLRLGSWTDPLSDEDKFDIILCNPPYIADADRDTLAPEVADHEPGTALFAGPDGLDDYRLLAGLIPRHLSDTGIGILEIGADQSDDVQHIFAKAGCQQIRTYPDLAGRDRCVVFCP